MKKLTEKDAIWCKTQKQWDSIIEMFDLKVSKIAFQGNCILYPFEKGISDCSSKEYAKKHDYNIIKAKDILNKSKIKELEKRVSKLENKNTTVSKMESVEPLKFDLPTKELEELPEKWCVKIIKEELLINWINKNQKQFYIEVSGILEDPIRHLYFHSESEGNYAFKNISIRVKDESFTEITFDQFKKWVLKEEVKSETNSDSLYLHSTKIFELVDNKIKLQKPLSIREVQVKVSSQEEANECAEIAKECGEEIDKIQDALELKTKLDLQFFRFGIKLENYRNSFGVYIKSENQTEISIQEYRERFGKKQETEIDWLKANYFEYINELNPSDKIYCISQPDNWDLKQERMKVIILSDSKDKDRLGYTSFVLKSRLKLCTEPITLKNE